MGVFCARRSRGSAKQRGRKSLSGYLGSRQLLLLGGAVACLTPASAQETITYEYDGRGRLIETDHSGTANDGVTSTYTYDDADNRTSVVISGNSIPPAPSFAINNASAAEGATLSFTVTRSGATTGTDTVQYATADGTALAGSDYTAITPAQTLTFNPGDTERTITVTSLSDSLVEGDETFSVNLSNPSVGTSIATGQGAGTIHDAAPGFSIGNASATEGGTLTFTVTRSGSSSGIYTVDYATADGTAVAGSDYTAISPPQTLTFGDGVTSLQITVESIEDSVTESDETFQVNLTNPGAGSSIVDGQGAGTIVDNDPSGPGISISSDGNVIEGFSAVFTVTATGISNRVDIDYATANGTAVAGTLLDGGDYTAKSGRLTFRSDGTQQVSVPTIDDGVAEGPETFTMNLSNATNGAVIVTGTATETINDAAPPDCSGVGFTIASNGAITEGANSVLTVTKTGSTSSSCSVSYATANGTAVAGSDYTAKSGTLTFTSAQTSTSVSVATTDDTTVESAETFTTSLSNPTSGATLGTPSSATATINDNDTGGTCNGVSFAVSNASVTEGGNLSFTVTKSGTTSDSCGVSYATANNTATAGSDYTAKSGTLTFSSTQTSLTVSVATTDDTSVENAETMYLNLSSPSGSATISDSQGVGTINDNDSSGSNQPPVCTTLTIWVPASATTTIQVTESMILNQCSDADGDTLTVTSPATPYNIYVYPNETPSSVNTVSDGRGGTTTQTIQVQRN